MSLYGDVSDTSLRKVVHDYIRSEDQDAAWERWKQMAKTPVDDQRFTPQQLDVIDKFFEGLREGFTDLCVEGLRRVRLVPTNEIPQIADILAQMFEEVTRADSNGNHQSTQEESREAG